MGHTVNPYPTLILIHLTFQPRKFSIWAFSARRPIGLFLRSALCWVLLWARGPSCFLLVMTQKWSDPWSLHAPSRVKLLSSLNVGSIPNRRRGDGWRRRCRAAQDSEGGVRAHLHSLPVDDRVPPKTWSLKLVYIMFIYFVFRFVCLNVYMNFDDELSWRELSFKYALWF